MMGDDVDRALRQMERDLENATGALERIARRDTVDDRGRHEAEIHSVIGVGAIEGIRLHPGFDPPYHEAMFERFSHVAHQFDI